MLSCPSRDLSPFLISSSPFTGSTSVVSSASSLSSSSRRSTQRTTPKLIPTPTTAILPRSLPDPSPSIPASLALPPQVPQNLNRASPDASAASEPATKRRRLADVVPQQRDELKNQRYKESDANRTQRNKAAVKRLTTLTISRQHQHGKEEKNEQLEEEEWKEEEEKVEVGGEVDAEVPTSQEQMTFSESDDDFTADTEALAGMAEAESQHAATTSKPTALAQLSACARCRTHPDPAQSGATGYLACVFEHAVTVERLRFWMSTRHDEETLAVTKHAVAAMRASLDLARQRQTVGACLRQPLPFTSDDCLAVDCMYLRTPIGTSHINVEKVLISSVEASAQNRSVLAIAQVSGAGKTKAALSASMCSNSNNGMASSSSASVSSSRSLLAVYALVSAGMEGTEAVKCVSSCIKTIERRCATVFNNERYAVDERHELFRECDSLYLRMVDLFYHCFSRRAALLCQHIMDEEPQLTRQELADALIRAQFRSQRYREYSMDMVAHLFATNVAHTVDETRWSRLKMQWSNDNLVRCLGPFYVVFDEVTMLQRYCRGCFMHQETLDSTSVQGGPRAQRRALLRKKYEKAKAHHCANAQRCCTTFGDFRCSS